MNPTTSASHPRRLYATVLSLLLATLAGCGFHLRGATQLPPEMAVTYVDSANPHSELAADLRRVLSVSGAQVTDDAARATAVLRVLAENNSRRVLSVGPTGKAREYELQYGVDFEVTGKEGAALVARQSVSIVRDFIFDETDVLGKAEEESLLQRDMRRDMVRLIMTRIGTRRADAGG